MSQQVTQNIAGTIQVLLTDSNVPVTGLVAADVTANLRKAGGSFAAFALTVSNFTEVGFGTYEIDLAAGDTDTLGTATVVVDGVDIDQSTTFVTVVAVASASASTSLEQCNVTGYVYDPSGNPLVGAGVNARIVGLPSIEQSVAAVANDLVSVSTDSNGYFILPLIKLADVEITIPAANYRRKIVVPNQTSVSLFTIP